MKKKFAVLSMACMLGLSSFTLAYGVERDTMAYLYHGTQSNFQYDLKETQQSIDIVSPNLFNLNSNGSLNNTKVIDKQFVEDMHSQGIKVTPFLSNHWDKTVGRNALNNYVALTEQILAVAKDYNLDGINIDIEGLNENDKESFTRFIKHLSNEKPDSLTLSVAVSANPYKFKTGWHGSYDYKEVAKYADSIIIMTYDESYSGSAPGPIASIDFVEKSIEEILKVTSSDKVMLGIPMYGRYWNNSKGGSGIPIRDLDKIKNTYNGVEHYSNEKQSPYLTFTIDSKDPAMTVYGQALKPGSYEVWYENSQSYKAKLKLVEKYNLKGTATWALGQEDLSMWSDYDNWLQGNYYKDTIDSWAANDIKNATAKGYLNGIDLDLFAPQESLTRGQMAAIICRVLDLDVIDSSASSYGDVNASNWDYKYINTVDSLGIMTGYNGSFRPSENITREEMAEVSYNILKGKGAKLSSFNDVSSDRWSKKYIDFANEQGLLMGYPDGSFKPTNTLTRAEAAAYLTRLDKKI